MSDPVGEAIEACEPPQVEVTRFRAVPVSRGRVVGKLDESRFVIEASVQPLTQKELQLLPEGARTQGRVKIYTQTELLTAEVSECKMPDRIRYRGVEYLVKEVDDWVDAGGYFKAIGVRTER